MKNIKNSDTYIEYRSENFEGTIRSSRFQCWGVRHPICDTLWPRFVYETERFSAWSRERYGFPYLLLNYVIDGEVLWNVDGRCYNSKKGHLFILPVGGHVIMSDSQRRDVKWIGFELHGKSLISIMENLKLNQVRNICLGEPEAFVGSCRKLYSLLERKESSSIPEISSLCFSILVAASYECKSTTDPAIPVLLENVLRAIQQETGRNYTCGELAERAHCCESLLFRLFQQHLSTTPQRYIAQYKMSLANKMIRLGELTHKEIANKLGYSDPGYFSRVYRRHHGFPPSKTLTT